MSHLRAWPLRTVLLAGALQVAVGGAPAAPGLPQQRPASSPFTFAERVDLATVQVTVTDGDRVPVADMTAADFELWEDGRAREPVVFLNLTDAPLRVAVVLDTSGSIESNVPRLRPLLRDFLSAFGAQDCVLMLPFSDDVGPGYWNVEASSFSDSFELGGGTRLHDAVLAGLHGLAADELAASKLAPDALAGDGLAGHQLDSPGGDAARGAGAVSGPASCSHRADTDSRVRRAVVLITDGEDTSSYATFGDVLAAAWEAGTPVVVLAVGMAAGPGPMSWSGGLRQLSRMQQSRQASRRLEELARVTGGRFLRAARTAKQTRAFQEILAGLRSSYLLGYRLEDAPPEGVTEWRPVEVKSRRHGAQVHAPEGIYVSRSSPESAAYWIADGIQSFDRGELGPALEAFDRAARDHWSSPQAHYYRALTAMRLQDWPVAEESARWAAFLDPIDPAVRRLAKEMAARRGTRLDPPPPGADGIAVSLWVDAASHDTLPRQQAATEVARIIAAHLAGVADVRLVRRPTTPGLAYGLAVRVRDIERDGEIKAEVALIDEQGEAHRRKRFEISDAEAGFSARDAPPRPTSAMAEAIDELLDRLRRSAVRPSNAGGGSSASLGAQLPAPMRATAGRR